MDNNVKFYMYQGYPNRIESDSNGKPIGGATLRPDGSWMSIDYGWEMILQKSTTISEEKAYALAGIKEK